MAPHDIKRYRWCLIGIVLLAAASGFLWPLSSAAQFEAAVPSQPMSVERARAMVEVRKAQAAAKKTEAAKDKKKDDAKEEKKDGDDKDKKEDKKEDEKPDSVKRPEKPPRVPDPREFDVKLDDHGRVPPFNFIGQPWPDVLQWLANISHCSLDWQELPNDYWNHTTRQSHTVDDVRDLINRALHGRGYTMLVSGEVLSVFKIEKIDPSLVPRITEDELYDHKPYDFAKVSFKLPEGMDVEKAKEDVKQLLSPNAKVFPLVTTKRLLLIDAVANLRTVSELLNEERMVLDGRIVPREFILRYARAEQVIDVLYVMVGLDPRSRPTQTELQVQQQRLQLMTQMQQKGTDVSKMLNKGGPPVFLAYNRQRNSVLVNAPPEQLRIIEQAIKYLDVPPPGAGLAAASVGVSAAESREFKNYQLVTLDPERLLMTLEEIGGLDPWTELRADVKSQSLWVQASSADHARIAELVKQFDGEGREFYVIQLRRVAADLAAISIKELIFGEEKKEDNNRRSYYSYYYGRRQEEEKQNPHEGFRIVPDVEKNRLLLRANESEIADVKDLLVQMGETPAGRSDSRPVRFIQPPSGAARDQMLEQLRRMWADVSDNELIIRVPEEPAEPVESTKKSQTDAEEKEADIDRSTSVDRRPVLSVQFVQFGGTTAKHPEEKPTPKPVNQPPRPAPVTITMTEDGRLMLSSTDTAALDKLEQLVEQISPPQKRFKVFRLKHVSAFNMYLTLYDYFEEELSGEEKNILNWFGYSESVGDRASGTGLGRRRKLLITWDTPSSTILVANASARQLWEVQELIAEYDRPTPQDSIKSRRTTLVKIRYSRASVIAAALKDLYRDLLSSRDKEFQSGDKKEQAANQERVTIYRYSSGADDDDNKRPTPVKLGFEGALSIAGEDVSNVLLISAQEEIFDDVVAMALKLDEEARPQTTVHVHRVVGNIRTEALQKALSDALRTPWPGGRPEKQTAEKPAGGEAKPKRGEGRKESGER